MKDNKRIIGICLTKVEDEFRTDFLSFFHEIADRDGFKVIVFNCPRDLYYGDINDKGAKKVFELINYDVIDALVILDECFYDKGVVDGIIDKAYENNVPVVLIHSRHDKCLSVVTDYIDAYKTLLRHIFDEHGAKHPVFIGGRKQDDRHTEMRLACFKEVLAEHGIAFSSNMLYYGEYWEHPTRAAINKILSSPDGIPDAIICANDTMALIVCEELSNNGYKVPDDIIVTGFDGLKSAEYFSPRLTTCLQNLDELALLAFNAVKDAVNGGDKTGVLTQRFVPFFSESCGCGKDNSIDYRERAQQLFLNSYETKQHEYHVYKWIDSVLERDNINSLSHSLSDYILPHSSVCLTERFIMTTLGQIGDKTKYQPSDDYIVITSMTTDYAPGKQGHFPSSDMMPDISDWLNDHTMCIITPITVGEDFCGYYLTDTDNIQSISQKLFRVAKTMNIAFGSLVNRLQKTKMQSSMLKARFIDPVTGLPNLKGLTKWFDEFSADDKNHLKTVMVSTYVIPQYKYIFENYGMDDTEEAVKFVADALRLANKDNGFIARSGNEEFVIFNYVDREDEVETVINNATSVFYSIIGGYNTNSNKEYVLEVNCGCTVANAGWNSSLSTFIKLANSEMYINRLKAGQTPAVKDEKSVSDIRSNNELYDSFMTLIEKNLFKYVFQPIIDAKTGNIYAYEALMRSSGGINMSPLQILDVAKEYNMLYEVEKATMFNIMGRYESEIDKFVNKKLFINTIPGSFLNKSDFSALKEKFGKYMHNFVFEITEQDTVSDEELLSLRDMGGDSSGQIAVDDYGTGHSNIVNLLRYAPHVIKIDRFLISNIQNDPNKQMFVKSTIEFAKMNNIKVLAEGVETYEELRTVIEFGVDLIQGYYTSRPAEDPISEIPENIKNEVISENLLLTKYTNDMLVYVPQENDTVDLYELALGRYGHTVINGGSVTFKAPEGQTFDTGIIVEPGCRAEITLDNVSIKAIDGPAIKLGPESSVVLRLVGKNRIEKNGILVPENASLKIVGDGSLDLIIKSHDSVGIGNVINNGQIGEITFAHTGEIYIEMQIDIGICIGGALTSENTAFVFESGKVTTVVQCVNSIGVGFFKGSADFSILPAAELCIKSSGRKAVAVGSFDGNVNIISSGTVDIVSDGDCCTALGSISGQRSEITIDGGKLKAVVHSSKATCIGSVDGNVDININGGHVTAYGEGDKICGYGSIDGIGSTCIYNGSANVKILSGCVLQFGGDNCTTVITGGNVLAAHEDNVEAFNAFGNILRPVHISEDSFTKVIRTHSGEYEYTAKKLPDDPELCVYIP
ncbi:MAG: EAL domain-containing protein [Ruminiclostridium sp.]|nr:EAL domain-containing protein [Ruminiclostridium sp.]